MSQTERYKRLRLLVHQLNKQRKRQASQIDILCHDLIGAQRSFLHRLEDLGFAAEFYRSLLGCTDVDGILARAGRIIKQELPGTGVTFFLRQPDGCTVHACAPEGSLQGDPGPQPQNSAAGKGSPTQHFAFGAPSPTHRDSSRLGRAPTGETEPVGTRTPPHEYLDPDLVEDICKRNRPCTLDEILDLGIHGDLAPLSRFSLVTLPLSDLGRSLGFALIYCPQPQVLNLSDVRRIGPVMRGLAQAVRAVRVPLGPPIS